MARKEEATLLIKIKQQGKEVLDNVSASFKNIIDKGKWVALGLAGVGTAIGKLALDASKFDEVKKSFSALVRQQGLDANKMIQNMKSATRGTITEMDLMKAANNALLLGLPVDRFDDMLQIARTASKATGESMEFMLQSIVTGLGRGSKLILDNLGIMVDTNKAYEKYAAELGKTADQLDDAEKKQAFINEAMAVGLANAEKLGSSSDTLNDTWARFKVSASELGTALGSVANPAMKDILDLAVELLEASKALIDEGFFDWIDAEGAAALTRFESQWNTTMRAMIRRINGWGEAWKKLKDFDFSGARDAIQQASDDANQIMVDGQKGLQKDLENINEELEKSLEKKVPSAPKWAKNSGEESASMFAEGFEANFAMDDIFAKFAENLDIGGEVGKNFLKSFDPKEGMKGIAKAASVAVTEMFLPGMGQAAGEVFEMLTMESEEFGAMLDQLFSVDFLENMFINITTLFTRIDELLINMFDALLNMLPELIPEVIASIIKAVIVGAPHIIKSLVEVFGSVNTWLDILRGMRDGVRIGLEESFKTTIPEVGKWLFEKMAEVFRKGSETDWDIFGGIKFDSFRADFQANINTLDWFSKMSEQWERIKDKFKINLPGIGGGGGGGGGGDFVEQAVSFVSTGGGLWGRKFGGLVPGFATGGLLQDDQLIGAQSGEFVVNRNSAQENLPLLNAINNSNGSFGGMGGNNITLIVNGGLMGDEIEARRFAEAIDGELLKLRQDNASLSFDSGVV